MGTLIGLHRYNGVNVDVYLSSLDSTTINADRIEKLYIDSNDNLWVGTVNGICRYNLELNIVVVDQVQIEPYGEEPAYFLVQQHFPIDIYVLRVVQVIGKEPEFIGNGQVFHGTDFIGDQHLGTQFLPGSLPGTYTMCGLIDTGRIEYESILIGKGGHIDGGMLERFVLQTQTYGQ